MSAVPSSESRPALTLVDDGSLVTPPAKRPEPAAMSVLVAALVAILPGRAQLIQAMALAFLSGEHLCSSGPPGTAKSLATRLFSQAFGLRYWEHLMHKFASPDEVLGPIDVDAFKAGKYERKVEGYLPTCEIAFLDEVFKSNSAILNALLGAMNERQITEGARVLSLPLMSMIGASNEWPDVDDGLGAVEDRFLFRVGVDYLADPNDFRAMLKAKPMSATLPYVDLRAERVQVVQVKGTGSTLDALVSCREALASERLIASDRRWRQILNALKASAHLDGRTETDPDDVAIVLPFTLGRPETAERVREVCARVINPTGAKASDRAKAIPILMREIPGESATPEDIMAAIARIAPQIKAIRDELSAMPEGRARKSALTAVETAVAGLRAAKSAAAARMGGEDL